MTDVVARLDDWGLPAWIGLMVIGFIVFWPIGLGILGYLIWSGRMGCCGRSARKSQWKQKVGAKWERKMERWGMQAKAFEPTGNHAFDEYRDEMLKRLEEEATEFQSFLDRLRMAKDKAEFEQFMAERRNRPDAPDAGGPGTGGPMPQTP